MLTDAKYAAERGDGARAEALLQRIAPGSLNAVQLARLQCLRAQLLLAHDQPQDALRQLPAGSAQAPALAPEIEWWRAQALFVLNDGPAAARALVERERYLRAPQEIADNHDAIWAGLFATPMDISVLGHLNELDPVTRGWVEAAVLVREGGDGNAWRQRYPNHPGGERLSSVRMQPALHAVSNAVPTPAQNIRGHFSSFDLQTIVGGEGLALLLPLSGAYAASGLAVRDGFLAAAAPARAAVRVYDSGSSTESAVAAYELLLRDGPAVVIGPLRKEAVTAIAGLGPSRPWLALNYLDARAPVANTIQFGLAPEDEARAAAEQAHARGLRRAIALVPQALAGNDWGERALSAFGQRLRELGGEVIAAGRYAPGTLNFAEPIKQLLSLDQSDARHRALVAVLGQSSEFEPRRRDDVDFIFVAARPADGRLIWPQFRFYRSLDLPIYATSAIFEGGQDKELNGLRVCDMPYMLDGAGAYASLRGDVADLASARQQPRLFALGYDAFHVASLMQSGELAAPAFAAASGSLSVANGAVARGLSCAEIKDGSPRDASREAPKASVKL